MTNNDLIFHQGSFEHVNDDPAEIQLQGGCYAFDDRRFAVNMPDFRRSGIEPSISTRDYTF